MISPRFKNDFCVITPRITSWLPQILTSLFQPKQIYLHPKILAERIHVCFNFEVFFLIQVDLEHGLTRFDKSFWFNRSKHEKIMRTIKERQIPLINSLWQWESFQEALRFKMFHAKLILLLVVVTTLATAQLQTRSEEKVSLSIEPFIVHGRDAIRGQFPFYVYLEVIALPEGLAICGASLISEQWVVTAAHCVLNSWALTTHLGSLRASDTGEKGRINYLINPADIHVHPKYSTTFVRK